MRTLTGTFTPVESLIAGQTVRYYGKDFTVAETLTTAVLSGYVVAARPVGTEDRVALIYSNSNALAELVMS